MALAVLGFSYSPKRLSLSFAKCLRHRDDGSDLATLSRPSSPHKWRVVIAYDGKKFAGWQYQESPPTIQCLIEKALTRITKLDRKQLHLVGAGRTDAGVHAWGQVAHFITPFNYDCLESIHAALNGLLPSEIRVREISPACPEFHARFSTISKLYHYKIYNGLIMDPFQSRYAYHSGYKLNPVVMREAASYFVGRHDFTSFANVSHSDGLVNPVKEIFQFHVKEMVFHGTTYISMDMLFCCINIFFIIIFASIDSVINPSFFIATCYLQDHVFQIEVEGTGFLYRQVRNMVALLIEIGREVLPPVVVREILAARNRRELAKFAMSAPPHGLCLMSVNYSDDILKAPAGCPASSFGRLQTASKCRLPFY
ncbi:uncharacterized protein LOC110111770 isoform X2 [Dendrobium catenatum]|uniref:uncharacterized protein LOC110111770 isoform X2 n=1 Tax=Dendrobium catenatum TaxID=906689 RepID=UPI00109F69E6|nr:uncharacterized protein LOC110111770 isoform X2 [Dendrobium catenatum]